MKKRVQVLLIAACALGARAADWPQWRGLDGGGRTAETVASTNWTAAPPVRLVLTAKGMLILLQATPKAYTPLGRVAALKGVCWIPPAMAGGRIYCRSNDGRLVCLGFPASAGKQR